MNITLKSYYTSDVVIKNKPAAQMTLRAIYNRNITRIPGEPNVASYVGNYTIIVCKDGDENNENRDFEIKYNIVAAFDVDDPNADENEVQKEASQMVYPYLKSEIAAVTAAAMIGNVSLPDYDSFVK